MTTSLRLCTASSCLGRGAADIQATLTGLPLKPVGCFGPCSDGPLLAIDDASGSTLVSLAGCCPVELPEGNPALPRGWRPLGCRELKADDPWFALQRRLVLERCGLIDPESLDDALAAGAYRQLQQVLRDNNPAAVIETVRASGLRGRGGAGYPTGLKWATVAAMPGHDKVLVCNGDEGDPGAFMDRTLMEGDPHMLLEGIVIAAFAVGASRAFLYVRAEYPLAIQRLRRAIKAAAERGLLGTAIAGSDFALRVELRVGAGAYVCGEETALMQSIEGRRGVPRPRPPYPAEAGVFGRPTLINNVETFGNVPPILRLGPERYGVGTKVLSLTGQVRRSGVLEVPLGTSLRTIVEVMGGGAPAGRRIKAIQTGGPSGGCVPAGTLDTPLDERSLRPLGTIIGSGGMVVLDDSTNMVELAAYFVGFCREESCGKCIPCRSGTVQLELLLRKLLERRGSTADLHQLEALCHTVKDASLCGLGQSAPNPVLSILRHFRRDLLSLLELGP